VEGDREGQTEQNRQIYRVLVLYRSFSTFSLENYHTYFYVFISSLKSLYSTYWNTSNRTSESDIGLGKLIKIKED
jgi:hypothetical protein